MGGVPNQKKHGGPVVVVPPDGGWGWMVVFGSFLIHVIADGITYSFGVIIEELLTQFGESKSKTAWIISILIAFTLGSGPIASAFTNRFGCRRTTMVGAVIASFGSLLSFFANGIVYLYFSVGLVTGIGFGLMYCPAIIIVTVYFEKKRAFATGVAVCGAGIGTFIFAPFTSYLLHEYLWQGTFLIYSGIILNCAVCGALFRDPPTKVVTEEHLKIVDFQLSSSIILDAIAEEDDTENTSVQFPSTCASAPHSPEKHVDKTGIANGLETSSVDDVRWLRSPPPSKQHKTSLTEQTDNKYLGPSTARSLSSMPQPQPHHHYSASFKGAGLRRRGISETAQHVTNTSAILNRKDLFYPGSVENLPEYRSNPDLYRSMTSLHRPLSTQEEPKRQPEGNIWDDIKEAFMTMADIAVLKDPIFLVFAISNLFTSMGMNPPLIFLPDRAKLLKIEKEAWLLSAFGIANTIGRLIIGFIADRPWANRLLIYNTCLTLAGVGTMLTFLCTSFPLLSLYSAFYGMSLSAYISLTSVILVDLLGLDKLTNAFGWILLFEGVASLVGAPLAGWIADSYKPSYDQSYIFAGSLIAISGLMLYPLPWLQRKLKQTQMKNAKLDNNTQELARVC